MQLITIPCTTCGDNMQHENIYCLNCKSRKETYFARNRSVFIYENAAKNLVISAKFNGEKYLAQTMSKFMKSCYLDNRYKCELITFVPSGLKRTKERGFNLAKLLADNLSMELNLPLVDTMQRINETHQINKDFKSRQENIKDAFKLLENVDIKNKIVLLVDDVYTTGATMNECSKVLKKAGAKEVFGLTFAHTQKKVINELN